VREYFFFVSSSLLLLVFWVGERHREREEVSK
jgi:hypothetical protein